jgi:SAM-dependent methyltransferase
VANRIAKAIDRRIGPRLRSIGDQVECPICGWTGHRFEPEGVGYTRNRRCTGCGAVERHRMLWLHLRDRTQHLRRPTKVLDVAPMPAIARALDREPTIDRVGVDLSPDRRPHVVADLTAAGLRDEAFDLTVCFHVLEHIPDDRAAMDELRRTLKPGGTLLVQVPLAEGRPTDEDPGADADERQRRFGQDDHVRRYGDDVVDRLDDAGFDVEATRPGEWLSRAAYGRYALAGDDQVILVCRRPPS